MVATPADVRGVGILLWPYCPMNEPLSANSPIFFVKNNQTVLVSLNLRNEGCKPKSHLKQTKELEQKKKTTRQTWRRRKEVESGKRRQENEEKVGVIVLCVIVSLVWGLRSFRYLGWSIRFPCAFCFSLHEGGERRGPVAPLLAVLPDKRAVLVHALYKTQQQKKKKRNT